MILIKNINQFDKDCIYFSEPVKNNIINNASFIKIIYSNSLFVLNGIYLNFELDISNIEKYYNKYKCYFDYIKNKELIDKIKNIEENILNKININKNKINKIYEQLKYGIIKILYLENNYNFNDNNIEEFKDFKDFNLFEVNNNETTNQLNNENNNESNINKKYEIIHKLKNKNFNFLLKITGIYETNFEYGLIYKFLRI